MKYLNLFCSIGLIGCVGFCSIYFDLPKSTKVLADSSTTYFIDQSAKYDFFIEASSLKMSYEFFYRVNFQILDSTYNVVNLTNQQYKISFEIYDGTAGYSLTKSFNNSVINQVVNGVFLHNFVIDISNLQSSINLSFNNGFSVQSIVITGDEYIQLHSWLDDIGNEIEFNNDFSCDSSYIYNRFVFSDNLPLYKSFYNNGVNNVVNNPNDYNLYSTSQYNNYGVTEYQRGVNSANTFSMTGLIETIFRAPATMFNGMFNFTLPLPNGESISVLPLMTFILTIGIAFSVISLIKGVF